DLLLRPCAEFGKEAAIVALSPPDLRRIAIGWRGRRRGTAQPCLSAATALIEGRGRAGRRSLSGPPDHGAAIITRRTRTPPAIAALSPALPIGAGARQGASENRLVVVLACHHDL